MSLLPKEHGAYGQNAYPLVTSLAVAGIDTPAALIAIAVIAGFLAHEPLLVLLGRRGLRARRQMARGAAMWCATVTTIAVAAGTTAVALMPSGDRWSVLLPLAPAAFLAAAIAMRREKSSAAETAVALAFSFAAVPICIGAGAPVRSALAVAIAFAVIFVTSTLAVRVVVLKVRGGGDPRATSRTRAAVFATAITAGAGLTGVALEGLLPWTTLVAASPGLGGAVLLVLSSPSPKRLYIIGWLLVSVSAATAVVLIVGLD